jgi:hypothetical protein
MVLIGAGEGGVLGPLTAAGLEGIDAADAGAASDITDVAHQLGGSLGLGPWLPVAARDAGEARARAGRASVFGERWQPASELSGPSSGPGAAGKRVSGGWPAATFVAGWASHEIAGHGSARAATERAAAKRT